MEFVSVVVGGHNVQQQDVFGFGVQAGHTKFHLREHLPGSRRWTQKQRERCCKINYGHFKRGGRGRACCVWPTVDHPPRFDGGSATTRRQRQLNSHTMLTRCMRTRLFAYVARANHE